MNYLITGGTGFIGAYVVRQLVAAGHRVTTFDIAPDVGFLDDLLLPEQHQSVSTIAGDVTDLPAVLRAVKSSGAQCIIHLAALLGARSNDNPSRSLQINCQGTLNVFEAALAGDIKRVVWASSVGVFGAASKRPKGAMANDAPHLPTDLYGACKSLNERFSRHYRRAYGLECVGLRYSLVYGYGKARTIARGTGADFMVELIDKPARGLSAVVPAGDAILDFIHVEDAARATILATQGPLSKYVALNIGGFRASLREVGEIVRSILPHVQIDIESGSWNGTDHHYDLSAAQETIGYSARIGLRDGLAENIEQIMLRAGQAG